jgi:hypothetical protein
MAAIETHLMSWATGGLDRLPGAGGLTAVLADPRHLPPLLASDMVDARTVVLVPGHAGNDDGPLIVGYEGSLSEPGAEFSHDSNFYLQIQAYGISEYMSVVGPTVVRVADNTDFETYLRDADRARYSGVFVQFLTNPVVQLADLPALGAGPVGDGPSLRLYVGPSGELSTSPGGQRLGTVGDSLKDVTAEWSQTNAEASHPCAVCLGGCLPESVREPALAERPWLGRYLAALHGIRDLRSRGLTVTGVSGFGKRLVPALNEQPHAADANDPSLPLLLWTNDSVYAHSPGGRRSFQLAGMTPELTEMLLVYGSVEAAAHTADRDKLERVCELFNRAGIDLTPAGA